MDNNNLGTAIIGVTIGALMMMGFFLFVINPIIMGDLVQDKPRLQCLLNDGIWRLDEDYKCWFPKKE